MHVRFLQRWGAYWPGANPVLEAVEAARLIAGGICEPFDKPPAPPAPAGDVAAPPDDPTDLEPTLPAEETIAPSAAIRKRGRRS